MTDHIHNAILIVISDHFISSHIISPTFNINKTNHNLGKNVTCNIEFKKKTDILIFVHYISLRNTIITLVKNLESIVLNGKKLRFMSDLYLNQSAVGKLANTFKILQVVRRDVLLPLIFKVWS